MGHDPTYTNREEVEREIAAGAQGQRARKRDQEEKDRVEENRNPEDEAARHERQRRPGFAQHGDEAADNFFGCTALHQRRADHRGDGDGEGEFARGGAELGHDGVYRLDERRPAGGEQRVQDADHNGSEDEREERVQAERDNRSDDERDTDQQNDERGKAGGGEEEGHHFRGKWCTG